MAGTGLDLATLKAESRARLNRPGGAAAPPLHAAPAVTNPTNGLGGFTLVGSVAVLPGDDTGPHPTVARKDTGYGITSSNLATVSARFIQTFGDDYDQIAVFLAFPDRLSPAALAYQQPVKNDVSGLGLNLFDRTAEFGSKGRMQTVLNMKRINLYGRDAAAEKENTLYAVWAQEAAHRWLVYLRYKREGDKDPSDALLGRQKAHWAQGVQAQGSIMDGFDWTANDDGTFTPGRYTYRYGMIDQYAMGLLPPEQVPPFFLLEDIRDGFGNPVTLQPRPNSGRYTAKRTDLTIADIIRAVGARQPASDAAAQDLRMGVVLLTAPGDDIGQLVGEAFQIDNTRRLWTVYYNMAGGGRGKVCTELFHPCRGDAFGFDALTLEEAGASANGDGVVAPGEGFSLAVTVTNTGDVAAQPTVSAVAPGLVFDGPVTAPGVLMAGKAASVTLTGHVDFSASCEQATTVALSAPGTRGGSHALVDVVLGLAPKQVETFEGAAAPAGWTVNPDGSDTGQMGRWAWGTPERSVAFDFTLQPGAAFSGQRAFVTGLSAAQPDNVEGRTTLESPRFALTGLRDPVLSYEVYFVSADFAAEVLVSAAAGSLRTMASLDGGAWTEVDRVVGMATGWQRQVVRLSGKLGDAVKRAASVQLRFVAEEVTEAARPVVEAALDEVGIYDTEPTCGTGGPSADGGDADSDGGAAARHAGDGCGCRLGGGTRRMAISDGGGCGLVGLGLAAMTLVRARTRRRRAAPRPPTRRS